MSTQICKRPCNRIQQSNALEMAIVSEAKQFIRILPANALLNMDDATGIANAHEFHRILADEILYSYCTGLDPIQVFSDISNDSIAEPVSKGVLTFEGVKSDALFSFQPPFNIPAMMILIPLKPFLTPRKFHTVVVFLCRMMGCPVLLTISFFERYVVGPSIRIETHSQSSSSNHNKPSKLFRTRKWYLWYGQTSQSIAYLVPLGNLRVIYRILTEHVRQSNNNTASGRELTTLEKLFLPHAGISTPDFSRREPQTCVNYVDEAEENKLEHRIRKRHNNHRLNSSSASSEELLHHDLPDPDHSISDDDDEDDDDGMIRRRSHSSSPTGSSEHIIRWFSSLWTISNYLLKLSSRNSNRNFYRLYKIKIKLTSATTSEVGHTVTPPLPPTDS
ncbi:hypothetical protein H4Q26_012842 [Puccinia striiformis f. sp. tritici PST-130]|nr:hypothetical protein H4Q26_012842 [Puccinia striiformis f. sp. tritici PST-130]